MGSSADKGDNARPDERKSLGGPFEPPPQNQGITEFLQSLNSPSSSIDCKKVYKENKAANEITSQTFDTCYYGKTNKHGDSLKIKVPLMQPWSDGVPRPVLVDRTTQGVTGDSRALDVFVHALPAVRPVQFENGKVAGSAVMITDDGIMATNHHVVDGSGGRVKVTLLGPDGKEELRAATVIVSDEKQDLALIQLDKKDGEKFASIPLSQGTSWLARERIVVMGNANGEGRISMADTRYEGMINQRNIQFKEQPEGVLQGRTMYMMESTVPHGYSGGAALSVPGSHRLSDGTVVRTGTSALRGLTDYSDLTKKAYFIPAERIAYKLNQYRNEQEAAKKQAEQSSGWGWRWIFGK